MLVAGAFHTDKPRYPCARVVPAPCGRCGVDDPLEALRFEQAIDRLHEDIKDPAFLRTKVKEVITRLSVHSETRLNIIARTTVSVCKNCLEMAWIGFL